MRLRRRRVPHAPPVPGTEPTPKPDPEPQPGSEPDVVPPVKPEPEPGTTPDVAPPAPEPEKYPELVKAFQAQALNSFAVDGEIASHFARPVG